MTHNEIPPYEQTTPKPFVFVLMPFDATFGDVYTLGIQAAASEAGAYAQRLDEQMFEEGMLDRIFGEINRADVIVADMSGRNPNVFYEVGYAHALGKPTILVTRKGDDIPFDLKHRYHIVYENITHLKRELVERIRWALTLPRVEPRGRNVVLCSPDEDAWLPQKSGFGLEGIPRIEIEDEYNNPPEVLEFGFGLRNDGASTIRQVSHLMLLLPSSAEYSPTRVVPNPYYRELQQPKALFVAPNPRSIDEPLVNMGAPRLAPKALDASFRLPAPAECVPPQAAVPIEFRLRRAIRSGPRSRAPIPAVLRVFIETQMYDFAFALTFEPANARAQPPRNQRPPEAPQSSPPGVS